jgi:predicted metal-dependent phosphoesterase TrpH
LELRIDLHVHTLYSIDSTIRPEELVAYARKRGLDGVAVTDHDCLESALKIQRETEFFILPGMEVSSLDGHIVGLNVKEAVPKGLSAEETVEKIHDAGGVAIACHPYSIFKGSGRGMKGSLGQRVSSNFDAVEVINASSIPFRRSVGRNEQLASKLNIARVAGSDAHYAPEIGYAYTLIESEPSQDDVANAIQKCNCRPFGKSIPLRMRLKRYFLSYRKSATRITHFE